MGLTMTNPDTKKVAWVDAKKYTTTELLERIEKLEAVESAAKNILVDWAKTIDLSIDWREKATSISTIVYAEHLQDLVDALRGFSLEEAFKASKEVE